MPFAEVCNALLITYVATEYSLSMNGPTRRSTAKSSTSSSTTSSTTSSSKSIIKSKNFLSTFLSTRHNQIVILIIITINLLNALLSSIESTSVITLFVKTLLERFLHIPKILLAAILYVIVLYLDLTLLGHHHHHASQHGSQHQNHHGSQRQNKPPRLKIKRFLHCVSLQFIKILPLYPLLVIFISFLFMVVISLLEHLHLPLDWLNWPIYYGTLYGPFSLVYFNVKGVLLEEGRYFIPISTSTSTSVWTTPTNIISNNNNNNNKKYKCVRDLRLQHFVELVKD